MIMQKSFPGGWIKKIEKRAIPSTSGSNNFLQNVNNNTLSGCFTNFICLPSIFIIIFFPFLTGSVKNEECYIYTPSGEELRSSYDLLSYVIQHPEYWNSFDPLEINFSGLKISFLHIYQL